MVQVERGDGRRDGGDKQVVAAPLYRFDLSPRTASLAIHPFDHPQHKVVLTREPKGSSEDETEGQKVAPRTRNEERELNRVCR